MKDLIAPQRLPAHIAIVRNDNGRTATRRNPPRAHFPMSSST